MYLIYNIHSISALKKFIYCKLQNKAKKQIKKINLYLCQNINDILI